MGRAGGESGCRGVVGATDTTSTPTIPAILQSGAPTNACRPAAHPHHPCVNRHARWASRHRVTQGVNGRSSAARNCPRYPIALPGGGPSSPETVERLRSVPRMSANGVHRELARSERVLAVDRSSLQIFFPLIRCECRTSTIGRQRMLVCPSATVGHRNTMGNPDTVVCAL